MEIRIDTSRDSKEDIRKAINFLKTIVGDAPDSSGQSFSSDTGSVLGSMFGDDSMPPPGPGGANNDNDDVPSTPSDRITIIPY